MAHLVLVIVSVLEMFACNFCFDSETLLSFECSSETMVYAHPS